MAGKKAEMWFSDYQTENVCLDIRIEKELYSFTVGDLIAELATGEVNYANINGIDYYFHVQPIKIEDYDM